MPDSTWTYADDFLSKREKNEASLTADDAVAALNSLQTEALSLLSTIRERKTAVLEGASLIISDLVKHRTSKPAKEETEWTVAVDLTTNFYKGKGVTEGLRTLRDLAKKTEGKDITFVVHAARPIDGDPVDPHFFSGDYEYEIDRYIIKNGKVNKLESVYSNGFASDLESLLKLTSARFNPKKLALIIDSHGSGNQGLTGDAPLYDYASSTAGDISVDDFVKSVQRGLKGSGREKVDLIDFDCCLMGQNGVVQRMQKITDNMIASSETEHIIGQNLKGPYEKLIANPKLTAKEFASEIMEAAKHQQIRDAEASHNWLWKRPVPVETLSLYDTTKAKAFDSELNSFGDLLAETLKDPKNAKAIDEIIDKTYTYGGKRRQFSMFGVFLAAETHGTKFDIKDFSKRVLNAIEKRELSDEKGELKKAAEKVIEAHTQLVKQYFGYGLYEKQGGLSVFLPGRNLRDHEMVARSKTSAFQVHEMGRGVAADTKDDDCLAKIAKTLAGINDEIDASARRKEDPKLVDQARARFEKVKLEFERLQKAEGKDFAQQLREFQKSSEELTRTAFFQAKLEEARKSSKSKTAEVYSAELVTTDNGWGRFRKALQRP